MTQRDDGHSDDVELQTPLVGMTTPSRNPSSSSSASNGTPGRSLHSSHLSQASVDKNKNSNNHQHHMNGSSDNTDDNTDVKHVSLSSSTNVKALVACSMYSFCSVSMILVNKSLASSYNHLLVGNLNILLVVFQAVVAVICVDVCKRLKWVDYPSLNFQTAKEWAPVNLFFCLMLFTGMASLEMNSVPMVTVFKNVTNILTTAGDYFFFDNYPEPLALVALMVMLLGAVFASRNDMHATSAGIFWMVANCVSTSCYVLYMRFATKNIKMSTFGMVFVNNLLCIVFLLPVAILNGEVSTFAATTNVHTMDYALKNVFAGWVGFFLNFASLNCVSVTGPTTYAIVGSLNKVPVAILGYLIFDNTIDAKTWFFIGVSMLGGFLYSYAKLQSAGHNHQAK